MGGPLQVIRHTFGLNLRRPNVDNFLYREIFKKLDYWSTMRLSLAERVVGCNQVLVFTLCFFIIV